MFSIFSDPRGEGEDEPSEVRLHKIQQALWLPTETIAQTDHNLEALLAAVRAKQQGTAATASASC
eukprot:m.433455 g.433455  ORF g.433455 m.433455 type:complete len:65 (+) comp20248_c5_seq4:101-295(+)